MSENNDGDGSSSIARGSPDVAVDGHRADSLGNAEDRRIKGRRPPPPAADLHRTERLPQTFKDNGDIMVVPDEVKRAVEDQTFTADWASSKKNSKTLAQASFIDQWGVYLSMTSV